MIDDSSGLSGLRTCISIQQRISEDTVPGVPAKVQGTELRKDERRRGEACTEKPFELAQSVGRETGIHEATRCDEDITSGSFIYKTKVAQGTPWQIKENEQGHERDRERKGQIDRKEHKTE